MDDVVQTFRREMDAMVDELKPAMTGAAGTEALLRRDVVKRLLRYAETRPLLDRARQLEAVSGDVVTALTDAQIAADLGDWEVAVEHMKGAKARVADAANLVKAVHDGQLTHADGAQLALPEVE